MIMRWLVSCVNECWGEMWDPFSPTYKTLTEPKTADLAVSETKSTIDFAAGVGGSVRHRRCGDSRRDHAG